ncbi:hypothetical protein ACET3X_005105 [Alternaria dauci]|uniref:Glutathione S-transferase n=1 Tax=Alternaria dauci TaxID=48095 RepID=A0ABR3UKN9_9PLEO
MLRSRKPKEPSPLKIVVLGEELVGKTCFIDMFLKGKHFISHGPIDSEPISRNISDISPRYREVLDAYIASADGVVLLYDVTSLFSFDHLIQNTYLQIWQCRNTVFTKDGTDGRMQGVKKRFGCVVVGSKKDIIDEDKRKRQVKKEMADQWASSQGFRHIELAQMSTTPIGASPLTLISATPSPFARMNRIALTLKGIPFELQNEIPWQSATETPKYNPLEKLPILLFPDGRPPVYDSAHIQEYIVRKYADKGPKLITDDVDLDLQIRQIVVLSEGCMDAIVIARFEGRREKEKQSQLWLGRQNRKIDGAIRAFDEMTQSTKEQGKAYLVGDELTIADIAVVCAIGFIEFAGMRPGWKSKYEALAEWFEQLDQRKEFSETRPVMFNLSETVV